MFRCLFPLVRRVVLTLAIPVLAAVAAAPAAAQATRPTTTSFTARLTFHEAIRPSMVGDCFYVGLLEGEGTATQLGRVTGRSQDCINLRGDPVFGPFAFHNSIAPSGLALVGDGGTLHIRYSGSFTPRPNAPHRISGLFVITGGTGRYVSATGGGAMEGSENIVDGQGQVTLTGLMSL